MDAPSFERLAAERYVSLATFRRNGTAVATPMWIAADGPNLCAVTNGTSAKMKRLKANDRVRIAACDRSGNVRGEWADGRARRIDDPAGIARAEAALQRKYGWQIAVLKFFSWLFGRARHRAFIEIRPA